MQAKSAEINVKSLMRGNLIVTVFAILLVWLQGAIAQDPRISRGNEAVGRHADGRVVTPVNQLVTPMGRQVDLPELRPQGLALSPDGKLLVTAGKTSELIVISPETAQILQ